MNIVSYGGGTNSTALLIGCVDNNIPVNLILFADTGGERPDTYEYIKMFSTWLKSKNYPEIITLHYTNKDGEMQTLEQDLLKSGMLPPPCYGGKSCSEKYKTRQVDKFCNNNAECQAVWGKGEKVTKFIGFDAGEERRLDNAYIYDIVDKKFTKRYPLINEWKWGRADCERVILEKGLTLPGKSSCFFCPNMKKKEIITLAKKNPDLFERACEIERNGKEYTQSAKGLGRSYSWEKFIELERNQIKMCFMFDDDDDDSTMPCGCYDG